MINRVLTVLKNVESAPGKPFLKSTTPQPPPPFQLHFKIGGSPPHTHTWETAPWALLYTTDLNFNTSQSACFEHICNCFFFCTLGLKSIFILEKESHCSSVEKEID